MDVGRYSAETATRKARTALLSRSTPPELVDEIIQEAWLLYATVVTRYDATKSSKVTLFYKCVFWARGNYYRKLKREAKKKRWECGLGVEFIGFGKKRTPGTKIIYKTKRYLAPRRLRASNADFWRAVEEAEARIRRARRKCNLRSFDERAEMFRMYYVENVPQVEIAKLYDVTKAAVSLAIKTHLADVKPFLKWSPTLRWYYGA
ncbi:MAG: hypothetical protein HUK22_07210 [Thermoguttaceae bacterium]|nr:hypothetical protein [Thermoguttaceae bacterium]